MPCYIKTFFWCLKENSEVKEWSSSNVFLQAKVHQDAENTQANSHILESLLQLIPKLPKHILTTISTTPKSQLTRTWIKVLGEKISLRKSGFFYKDLAYPF